MLGVRCPNCGKVYKGLAAYCSQCGIKLEKDKTDAQK